MTYLTFHLIFIIPPILLLGIHFMRNREARLGRQDLLSLVAVAIIALLYTTAWDNYLVYRGVWGYGPERVLATIGYVPVEEYLFFLLQPLLTGLWFFALKPLYAPRFDSREYSRTRGAIVYLALAVAGLILLRFEQGLYLGLILVWAGPVLMGQWIFAGSWIWRVRKIWLVGISVPTLYLWVADRIAIALGIWYIERRYTLGIDLFGLPLEEAVFFLVTNILVVQGLILFTRLGEHVQREGSTTL